MDNINENIPVEENGGIETPPPPPPPPPTGIRHINIEDDMKASYIDYAMSVIVGRALPDVRDGL